MKNLSIDLCTGYFLKIFRAATVTGLSEMVAGISEYRKLPMLK
jgi:hypothetical protein